MGLDGTYSASDFRESASRYQDNLVSERREAKRLAREAKHEKLEKLFDTPVPEYGFRDVIRAYRHPFRTDEVLGKFSDEFMNDVRVKPYLPRKARVLGSGLGLAMLGFGITAIPHEAMHAAATVAVGGACEEIAFNRLYGGDLWASMVPGAEAKTMLPFIGGYIKPVGLETLAQNAVVGVAPYVLLAPLGIYCAIKARERRSLPLAMLASGLNSGTLGSELGDARNMVYRTGDSLAQTALGTESSVNNPSLLGILASFVVASHVVRGLYRLTRGAINDARRALARPSVVPETT